MVVGTFSESCQPTNKSNLPSQSTSRNEAAKKLPLCLRLDGTVFVLDLKFPVPSQSKTFIGLVDRLSITKTSG